MKNSISVVLMCLSVLSACGQQESESKKSKSSEPKGGKYTVHADTIPITCTDGSKIDPIEGSDRQVTVIIASTKIQIVSEQDPTATVNLNSLEGTLDISGNFSALFTTNITDQETGTRATITASYEGKIKDDAWSGTRNISIVFQGLTTCRGSGNFTGRYISP